MTVNKKEKNGPIPILPKNLPLERLIRWVSPYWREAIGGAVLLLAATTLLNFFWFADTGFNGWWAGLLWQLFGWGAVPAVMMLGGFGGLLVAGRFQEAYRTLPLDRIIGAELLLIAALAAMHLLAASDAAGLELARRGEGGGFVGWGISNFLVEVMGRPLTGLFLAFWSLVGLVLCARLTTADADRAVVWARSRLKDHLPPEENGPNKAAEEATKPPPKPRKIFGFKFKEPPTPAPTPSPAAPPAASSTALPKTAYALPPLDLLLPPTKDTKQGANARYQAQIIEETLHGFGLPVEVVEVNHGPTVTQFGLKVGTIERRLPSGEVAQQRVRVNKIVALTNDLALALAAAPIRIEAPVPGRPVVGIEVPNGEKTLVSLRAVIEDQGFKQGKGALRVALGKGIAGLALSAPLAEMPHLLIAGATGSGKSVCINALIATLLFTYGPEQLRFLMIDPKMVELTGFNGIPHLIAPVVTDFEQVVGALAWATREMERRYKLFAAAGARSIDGYNRALKAKDEALPYLVVVIDELADLMMMAPDEVERHICRIAQMARATGIHLVIATQRPSVDVVTGLIKANFPARIAFAVTSQIDSRVILDTPGAERLLGQGDMLYMAPDSPRLHRLQGCFVSDAELNNLVGYWRHAAATSTPPKEAEPPWADILAEAGKDDLLNEATKLVLAEGKVSTSFLQRRLGIGYPRASRLMDQLEAEGVIGPAEGSRPRELRWGQEESSSA
jgi:S-DNA-T family DNA segregation ATPase FtsK/SpoIIIE